MNVFSPCRATSVSTCWALLTLVPRCSRYRADTLATLTLPPPAAEGTILCHASLSAGTAVTILPCPATLAVTVSAVTHSMTYNTKTLKQHTRHINMWIISNIQMWLLTSTQLPTETDTRVIVTFAVRSVDAAKAGCMTHTLSAVALPLTTAYLGLIVCKAVIQQSTFLIALALCSQEAWLTHAHATLESPLAFDAVAAVCLRRLPAVTGAKRLQFHLQSVL